MEEEGADLTVLAPGGLMQYLGIDLEDDSAALLLVFPSRDPVIVAHSHYQGEIEPVWSHELRSSDNFRDEVKEVAGELEIEKVLLEEDLREKLAHPLKNSLDAETGLFEESIEGFRAVKDDAEKEALREASEITDRVVERVRELGSDATGMTERELQCQVDSWLEEEGAEDRGFPTKIAAGENAAEPHHDPSNREIGEGEPVVMDFGAVKDGYTADQTRTVVFSGGPGAKFREVFDVVRRALEQGKEMVEPGVEASDVHEAVSSVIDDAGYSEQFLHITGHGVGLEVHESPRLGPESDIELEERMAVTVEPGIYIDGEFGIRIEDLLLVKEGGAESLNQTSYEWKL